MVEGCFFDNCTAGNGAAIYGAISLLFFLAFVLVAARWELASMRWASMSLEERVITSHDLSGCWLHCGHPCGWALTSKRPIGNDPNRLQVTGLVCLAQCLPCPVGKQTWTRNRGTNSFRSVQDANVTHYASDRHATQSCCIFQCKLCGGEIMNMEQRRACFVLALLLLLGLGAMVIAATGT